MSFYVIILHNMILNILSLSSRVHDIIFTDDRLTVITIISLSYHHGFSGTQNLHIQAPHFFQRWLSNISFLHYCHPQDFCHLNHNEQVNFVVYPTIICTTSLDRSVQIAKNHNIIATITILTPSWSLKSSLIIKISDPASRPVYNPKVSATEQASYPQYWGG